MSEIQKQQGLKVVSIGNDADYIKQQIEKGIEEGRRQEAEGTYVSFRWGF